VLLLTVVFPASAAPKPDTVTIVNAAPLTFGSVAGAAGGTVTIAPDGTRTAAGVFPVGGSFNAAAFTITVSGGNPHYMISLPPTATLTSPTGASMVIDTFRSNPAARGSAKPPAYMDTLAVGATLRVAPSQAPGSYSGAFQIVVNL
jgi:hypothetical protein